MASPRIRVVEPDRASRTRGRGMTRRQLLVGGGVVTALSLAGGLGALRELSSAPTEPLTSTGSEGFGIIPPSTTARSALDGVPGLTQPPIAPGRSGSYRFRLPHPGTYWYHPHVGVQPDRGLYGALIVDDPAEPGRYELELVVVLDDWLDGTGRTPDDVMREMRGGMMDMRSGPKSAVLGSEGGDVAYPHYLLNGRLPSAPPTFRARPGQRARIRIVNAGADTAFRVALGGHRLTVTHSDGFPVRPVTVDTLVIAMGERYDLEVRLGDGAFPLVAVPEGKYGQAARAIVWCGCAWSTSPACSTPSTCTATPSRSALTARPVSRGGGAAALGQPLQHVPPRPPARPHLPGPL